MQLNEIGQLVKSEWNKIPVRFNNVKMDKYTIMPNHLHGIIQIVGATLAVARDDTRAGTSPAPTLGRMIGTFKSVTALKYINRLKHTEELSLPSRLWQRNYYEHIIRNEDDLFDIRNYIESNPVKWDSDKYFSDSSDL